MSVAITLYSIPIASVQVTCRFRSLLNSVLNPLSIITIPRIFVNVYPIKKRVRNSVLFTVIIGLITQLAPTANSAANGAFTNRSFHQLNGDNTKPMLVVIVATA